MSKKSFSVIICRKETSIKKGLRLDFFNMLNITALRRKETSIKKGLRPVP